MFLSILCDHTQCDTYGRRMPTKNVSKTIWEEVNGKIDKLHCDFSFGRDFSSLFCYRLAFGDGRIPVCEFVTIWVYWVAHHPNDGTSIHSLFLFARSLQCPFVTCSKRACVRNRKMPLFSRSIEFRRKNERFGNSIHLNGTVENLFFVVMTIFNFDFWKIHILVGSPFFTQEFNCAAIARYETR